MPIDRSSSRSSAMRCSAERPRRPNASRSPRTSRTCLSRVTRPSAEPRGDCSTSPVWHGSSAAAADRRIAGDSTAVGGVERIDLSADRRASAMPVQPESTAGPNAVLVRAQPDRGRLDPQRHVLGDQRDVRDPRRPDSSATARMRASLVSARKPGRQHEMVGMVQLDLQRAAVVVDRDRRVQPAVLDPQLVEQPQRLAGRTSRAPGGGACPPAR